ncbi:FAD-dependent monooxygenase [Lentzea sp. HUAS12]|uniref:FAD-dependent monooxygenase n=1 Tax=Lentzea sp. HUAS12 TaxID=2951806 RepID=UPI00209D781C|nr:FAD-dependent monooxygenase [Lentzea sp. HUAS12]USX48722.1 FAD-dependent monooxygenase [Lentzea sp. HUAS12]
MTKTQDGGHRVLVVGLGISGITTALRLREIGWTPVIIERAPERRTGGYFVGLFGAGKAAARRMGVLDRIKDRTSVGGHNFEIDRTGNRRVSIGFRDLPGKPLMLLRGDVEQAAFEGLPDDVEIRFGTVPTAITQDADGVTVTLSGGGRTSTERFDLVVGADGLRSSVRQMVFGPHESYLHRFDKMVAAFALPDSLSELAGGDGATLLEPGRSMWIFPFADHAPCAMLSWQTEDVDAEFTKPHAERLREVFGPEPLGRALEETLAAAEHAEAMLFDSIAQVRMGRWSRGRVVLVGDSAWCVTLWAGMGVSAGLAGADLLATMLQRYPVDRALAEWERRLRPYIDFYQHNAVQQRAFFLPVNRWEMLLRWFLTRGHKMPVVGRFIEQQRTSGKASRMKEADIACV